MNRPELLAACRARGGSALAAACVGAIVDANREPFGHERVVDVLMQTNEVDGLLDAARNAGGTLEDRTAVTVERR